MPEDCVLEAPRGQGLVLEDTSLKLVRVIMMGEPHIVSEKPRRPYPLVTEMLFGELVLIHHVLASDRCRSKLFSSVISLPRLRRS